MLLDLRCKAALGPNKVEAGKKEKPAEEGKKKRGGGDGAHDKQR